MKIVYETPLVEVIEVEVESVLCNSTEEGISTEDGENGGNSGLV